MNGWKKSLVLTCVVALLAGCAEAPQQQAKAPSAHRHVSPEPVEPPTLPPGSFDHAAAAGELAAAGAARQAGNPALARQAAEAAVDHWPADRAAWQELQTDCQALGDASCVQYAAFFGAKIEFVATLPAKAAVLGFQSMVETVEDEEDEGGNPRYDPRTVDMARRLWAFYHVEDIAASTPQQPTEPSFSEKYPYAPMLLVGGIVGGLLTGIKTLANK